MLVPLLIFLGVGGVYYFFVKKPAALKVAPGDKGKGGKTAPGEGPPAPGPHEPPPGGTVPGHEPPPPGKTQPAPTPPGGAPGGGVPTFDLHYPGGSAYANNPSYIRAYQGALAFLAKALSQPSFDPGAITGTLDAATKAAVQAFQRSAHLTADGLAGPMTASALVKALASAASAAHTGQTASCRGEWIPAGPALQHVPPYLRQAIAAAVPAIASHPQCPAPGSHFVANVGGGLVQFYCAAPGLIVPIAYCASLAQAGWMIAAPHDPRPYYH